MRGAAGRRSPTPTSASPERRSIPLLTLSAIGRLPTLATFAPPVRRAQPHLVARRQPLADGLRRRPAQRPQRLRRSAAYDVFGGRSTSRPCCRASSRSRTTSRRCASSTRKASCWAVRRAGRRSWPSDRCWRSTAPEPSTIWSVVTAQTLSLNQPAQRHPGGRAAARRQRRPGHGDRRRLERRRSSAAAARPSAPRLRHPRHAMSTPISPATAPPGPSSAIALAVLGLSASVVDVTATRQRRRQVQGQARRRGPWPSPPRWSKQQDVSIYRTGIGTVTPTYSVTVKARVDGQFGQGRLHRGPGREGRPDARAASTRAPAGAARAGAGAEGQATRRTLGQRPRRPAALHHS